MRSNEANGRRKESVWRSVPAQPIAQARVNMSPAHPVFGTSASPEEPSKGSHDKTRPESLCNRRAYFRIPTVMAVTVLTSSDAANEWAIDIDRGMRVLETITEDVSIGGLRFRAPNPLPSGSNIEIELPLDSGLLLLDAVVTHVASDEFGANIGAAFVSVGEVHLARLARFISGAQRSYLPTVSAAFNVRCRVEGSTSTYGVTRQCAPGYVETVLADACTPGSTMEVLAYVDEVPVVLRGRVVSCRPRDGLWRTGIELGDLPPAVASRWRDIVIDCRDGLR
jgi:hypothetical protein